MTTSNSCTEEETDFKQQEISESKDLFAESNHLLNQLQNQNFALMASVGESDSKKFFENDTCHCARDSEVARLKSDNNKLERDLQKIEYQYSDLQIRHSENLRQSQTWECERAKFKDYSSRLFDIIGDCSQKLQKLETDQKLFENQYNLLSVIVQNAMNGINFLRMQLEKQKQENLVVTLKNAELLTNFYEMEQINRRNEDLISQLQAEIQGLKEANLPQSED